MEELSKLNDVDEAVYTSKPKKTKIAACVFNAFGGRMGEGEDESRSAAL